MVKLYCKEDVGVNVEQNSSNSNFEDFVVKQLKRENNQQLGGSLETFQSVKLHFDISLQGLQSCIMFTCESFSQGLFNLSIVLKVFIESVNI